jgi:DNA-binding response OmpR family regulator
MGKRILAIDDNPAILDVLNEILSFEGYEVVTISDGRKVFDTVEKIHPDLILLDVMLDNLDGREICRALKKNHLFSNIPVIMISATHDLMSFLNQPGAPDDFIAKPFDIYYLISKVNHQLAA